jgi:hypothetical protein
MKHSSRRSPFATVAVSLLLMLLAPASRAEMRQYGSFEVHYSVFASSFLQPDIAAAYGIVRAKDRALVNIAVRRGTRDAATVSAVLSGTRGDLIRKMPLEFREIREDQALYYIAEFGFVSGETQYFDIAIQPAGEARPLVLQFNHVLYAD